MANGTVISANSNSMAALVRRPTTGKPGADRDLSGDTLCDGFSIRLP